MILNLLSNKNFITYNKVVAKAIGLEEALCLGEICSLSNIRNDVEFYFTYAQIQEETCLTEYAVRKAVQNLIKLNILSVTRKGNPCKSWYTINEDAIIEILECQRTCGIENRGTSGSENDMTSGIESEGSLIKKDIKERYKDKDINIGTDAPKAKKPPLVDREPANDIEKVEKEYLLNYRKLYNSGVVKTESPVINWGQSRALTKKAIETYGLETILDAVQKSVDYDFCVQKGYTLTTILSAGCLANLINGNGWKKGTSINAFDKLDGAIRVDF